MACWQPINLRSETQKKLGLPGVSVPCGHCIGCLSKRRQDWIFRLKQELSVSTSASFLTLTYEDLVDVETGELVPPDKLVKSDLQKYFKRIYRKVPQVKYFAVGEYGEKTKRPHYHAIVFNVDKETLAEKWYEGITHQGTVSDQSISYVTKYCIKPRIIDDPLKPFAIMSKGLGKIYLKHGERYHKSHFTYAIGGEGNSSRFIPRYYREKIFTEEERGILRQKYLSQSIPLSAEERRILRQNKKEEAKKLLADLRSKKEISKRLAQKKNSKDGHKSKNY